MHQKTSGDTWASRAALGEYAATSAASAADNKEYVVEGILPASGAAIFFGPGSTGKTQFLLWLACHLAAVGPSAPSTFLGAPIRRRGQILVLSAEDLREDLLLRIRGIALQMRREGHETEVSELCGRLHVVPFLSLDEEEFGEPSPSLFQRDASGTWGGTRTLDQVENLIADWNDRANDLQKPEDRIIGVIMDSAVSMAGFELANTEATTNLLFRINRVSRKQDVFWAIIGHTPKDPKNDDPTDGTSRLRGSAMWSTSPRTVVELRIAGEHENLWEVHKAFPSIVRRDIVIAAVAKSNSKGADFRPRVLRRLPEGAFEDITDAFPTVCESYADWQDRKEIVTDDEVAAVIELIRAATGGTAGAKISREDLRREHLKRKQEIPALVGMIDDTSSASAKKRHSLAAAIKLLAARGALHMPRNGSLVVVDLDVVRSERT